VDDSQLLIIRLAGQTALFTSDDMLPNKALRIGEEVTTLPSFPPWPVCADVLVNSESRSFVGLTYPIDGNNRDLVRRFSSGLDPVAVRYNDLSLEAWKMLYRDDDPEIHHLEVLWSDIGADSIRYAQLDSGMWYYDAEHEKDIRVLAFGLTDINTVLREYDLIL